MSDHPPADRRVTEAAPAQALYESRDGLLTITSQDAGIQVSVGQPHDFRSSNLGPEEVAHLAHALNKWIAGFTNNA